ncbi:hypothetical protein H6504_01840 [Candidatus Woesearchaeota archaeon]|nr:hypothetical protein [Candidatus Woesearchaeota archaeon]
MNDRPTSLEVRIGASMNVVDLFKDPRFHTADERKDGISLMDLYNPMVWMVNPFVGYQYMCGLFCGQGSDNGPHEVLPFKRYFRR